MLGETNIIAEAKLCTCNARRLLAAGWDHAKQTVWQDQDCAVISAARPDTIGGGTMEATEMFFAATNEVHRMHDGRVSSYGRLLHTSVCLPGNLNFAATVQFAEYYMLIPLIVSSNLLPPDSVNGGRRVLRI